MKIKILSILLLIALLIPTMVFPVSSADEVISFGLNAINCNVQEGHSGIYTSKWGKTLVSGNLGSTLDWNRLAVFEWDSEKEAFIVTEISTTVGNGAQKDALIPEDGFVLTVNLGNDYSASNGINYTNKIANNSFYAFEKLEVGMTAYVVGVDFENSKLDMSSDKHYSPNFTSNAAVYINSKPNADIYTPDVSKEKLNVPTTDDFSSTNMVLEKDLEIKWNKVENATKYFISVYDSTTCPNGKFTVKNVEVNDTSYTLKKSNLKLGTYTVVITASADGYRSSSNKFTISVVKESALTSIFKDKVVVAFGDSLTELPGWVSMLKSELGTEVINAGFRGDTTLLAIQRIEEDVLAYNPDVVIMNFGMNDHAEVIATKQPLVDLRTYENTYRTMIKRILKSGAKIVLVTHNGVCTESGFYSPGLYGLDYGSDTMHSFFDVVKSLAEEYDLGFIDIYDMSVKEGLNKICLQYDGIHLSSYGQEKYFEWISTYLLENFTSEDDFITETSEDNSTDVSFEESITSTDETSNESLEAQTPISKKNIFYIVGGVLIIAVIFTTVLIIRRKK